jgi:quercetin dioxygenase-like cupin family protein
VSPASPILVDRRPNEIQRTPVPIIVRPQACPTLPGPFEVKVTVRGEHTGGVLASIEETLQPRAFVTPHTHANDVWVYVLSGRVGVLVGDEIGEAGAGEWALKPRNVPHAMWNASHEPARLVEVLTPAGTERWFEEIAALDATDDTAFDVACRRHGITFHGSSPWTARIRERYDL